MGCLFHCFRARAAEPSTIDDSVSQPSGTNSNRGHDSKNRLSALFLSQEKADLGLDSMRIHKELNDEAQLLNTYDTTTATPIEIRKASEKLETPQQGKQFISSQFHSWISSNSDAVFHLDEKSDESGGEVSEQTPSSCMTDARNSARISTGYSDAGEESIGTEFRDGVDRSSKATSKIPEKAECEFDRTYSSTSSKIPEKAGKGKFPTSSSYLTSLKLSDEIQTPGTITPASIESVVRGETKNQVKYVRSASNLIETVSICKLFEDSDESLEQTKEQACKEKKATESPLSVTCEAKLEESSASPSPWVKQSEEKSNQNTTAISTVTYGDRPIIGTAAAYWKEKEKSQISPKWWDGNGIPNSYKQVQRGSESELARNIFRGEIGESTFRRMWSIFHHIKKT